MAFYFVGPRDPHQGVAIDSEHESLLWELPQRLGLETPQCDRLWERFYDSPELRTVAEVQQLRNELAAVRSGLAQLRRGELVSARNIRARDPVVVEQILAPMLAADPLLAKCDELIALCDQAVAAGCGLETSSD